MSLSETMTNEPLVSIICVTKNESAERVNKTLESILGQSWPRKEIIIVDGCSDEEALQHLNVYKKQITTFISEPDNGIFEAMNKGIRLATGDWLVFMNMGDTFTEPEIMKKVLSFADGERELLYGDVYWGEGERTSKFVKKPNKFSFFLKAISHQTMFIRKDLFDRFGGYGEDFVLGGDTDWGVMAVSEGVQFYNTGLIVARYAEGGISTTNPELLKKERERIFKHRFNRLEQLVFLVYPFFFRFYRRLQSGDFSIPVFLRPGKKKK